MNEELLVNLIFFFIFFGLFALILVLDTIEKTEE